jgi:hypothetical protein
LPLTASRAAVCGHDLNKDSGAAIDQSGDRVRVAAWDAGPRGGNDAAILRHTINGHWIYRIVYTRRERRQPDDRCDDDAHNPPDHGVMIDRDGDA